MTELEASIRSWFSPLQVVYLATSKNDQPAVRPVTLIFNTSGYWIATGCQDAKMQQMIRNPQIEFCLPVKGEAGNGYIRASGQVCIINDIEIKRTISKAAAFIKEYWQDPADPGFCLLKLQITCFEYLAPGETYARRVMPGHDPE
ncbi:MAG: pyridoxamine 5'-phosphate oxidase family protein [Candidatus Cloacimonetes bacterium]|nr:pyridoxamine 5'-phosphate oxidase family protein [Candidatus Cloacimonadota bacterium]